MLLLIMAKPSTYHGGKIFTGMINDRPHYTHDDGGAGVWYDGNSWNVGSIGGKGTERAGLYAESTASCPEDPTYNWQYYDGSDWNAANKGFSLYCKD